MACIQRYSNLPGFGMDNENGLRTRSNTGLSEIVSLGFFSRLSLSISRLNRSIFSVCALTSCLASRMSKYNIAPMGRRNATSTQHAIQPITSSPNDLRTGTTSTGKGGIGKSLRDTLTFAGGFFLLPAVAIVSTSPAPLPSA